jgi:hypothetical protein
VIGFRAWVARGSKLTALGGEEEWPVGVCAARCREDAHHTPPVSGCGCGIYAVHDPAACIERGTVVGAILAWGRLEVHHEGFRAEYARPVALARGGVERCMA